MIIEKFKLNISSFLNIGTLFSPFLLLNYLDLNNSRDIKYFSAFLIISIIFNFFLLNSKKIENYYIQNLIFFNIQIFYVLYIKFIYFENKIYYYSSEFSIFSSLIIFVLSVYTLDKNFEKNKFLIIQFLFFSSILNIGLLGVSIIYLYFKYNFNFNFSRKEQTAFRSLPALMIFLKGVASTSEVFNDLWLVLIRKPFSGLSRFYDMQLVLSFMECNDENVLGSKIFYSSYTECQQPYSPIYEIFTLSYDIKYVTFALYSLLSLMLVIGYMRLIKTYTEKEEFIVLFLLSPPVNFLFYQGNLDLIPFIVSIFLFKDINKNKYLKIFLIFLLSIFEIHPVGLLIGLSLYYLKSKQLRPLFSTITFILLFFAYLFFDFKTMQFSNNFLYIITSSDSYVSDIYSSFGLKLDLGFIARFLGINIYILIFITLMLGLVLLVNRAGKGNFEIKINSSMLFPFFVWLSLAVLLENPVYRLSLYFLLFVILFKSNSKLLDSLILFSVFINPTPAYDAYKSLEVNFLQSFNVFNGNYFLSNSFFSSLDILLVFINRAGIYFMFAILLLNFLKKLFRKEPNKDFKLKGELNNG